MSATALLLLALVAGDPVGDAIDAARPRPEEERWRLVPWRTSLTDALREAREHDLPVFLFGYDGVLGSGNC